MIGDDLIRKILLRVQALEAWAPRFRVGTVTDDSPLTITLGGGDTPIIGVKAVRAYTPIVGDIVSCVNYASDLLVLGAIGAAGPWIAPTLLNSWANVGGGFATAGYYKDAAGIVHLRGLVTSGAASTIFNLPAGYRPALIEDYAQSQNSLFSQMRVRDNGDVQQITAAARTNQFIGYSFRAEN